MNCVDEKLINRLEPEKKWLRTDLAASYLGISKQTLLNETSNGKVPFYKFGRRNYYLIQELDSLMRKVRFYDNQA